MVMEVFRTSDVANTARESSLGEKVAANSLPDSMNSLAQPCSNSGGARKWVAGILSVTLSCFFGLSCFGNAGSYLAW